MSKLLHSVIFLAISTIPILLTFFIKKKYKKLTEPVKDNDGYYHQTIFINMKNFECREHLIYRKECSDHCSYNQLKRLLNFVSTANISICLCTYVLTLKQFNLELVKAHQRGVRVRVITDNLMLQHKASQDNFLQLSENGVLYKFQPSDQTMMHHKFCLIDKEDEQSAKMFFGSMNLTTQALCSNFDAVILTNNQDIMGRYSKEFEELWTSF